MDIRENLKLNEAEVDDLKLFDAKLKFRLATLPEKINAKVTYKCKSKDLTKGIVNSYVASCVIFDIRNKLKRECIKYEYPTTETSYNDMSSLDGDMGYLAAEYSHVMYGGITHSNNNKAMSWLELVLPFCELSQIDGKYVSMGDINRQGKQSTIYDTLLKIPRFSIMGKFGMYTYVPHIPLLNKQTLDEISILVHIYSSIQDYTKPIYDTNVVDDDFTNTLVDMKHFATTLETFTDIMLGGIDSKMNNDMDYTNRPILENHEQRMTNSFLHKNGSVHPFKGYIHIKEAIDEVLDGIELLIMKTLLSKDIPNRLKLSMVNGNTINANHIWVNKASASVDNAAVNYINKLWKTKLSTKLELVLRYVVHVQTMIEKDDDTYMGEYKYKDHNTINNSRPYYNKTSRIDLNDITDSIMNEFNNFKNMDITSIVGGM